MSASSKTTVTFTCETCGKEVTKFKRADAKNKFCSLTCVGKSHIEKYGRYDRQGEKHPNWKGGIRYSLGYKLIRVFDHPFSNKQGYVQQHRLVMEEHLGRYLTKKERVHHLNGNKLDNNLENLLLLSSQSDHIRLHLNEKTINNRFWKGKKMSVSTRMKMSESGKKAWEVRKSLV